MLPHLQADPPVESLYVEVATHFVSPEESSTESPEYFRLMLRLRERTRDRLRFAFRLAFTPSVGEWQSVRLPASLFPLYRLVRLVRLAKRLAGVS
jgi:hypothetical protein